MRRLCCLSVLWVACQAPSPEPRFEREVTPNNAELTAPSQQKPVQAQPAQVAAPQAPVEAPPPPAAIVRRPTSPDPLNGKFPLADALKGLPGKGAPKATIETSLGTLECKLWPDKAPLTVANFVGLARGLRPFWDGRSATWAKRPLFDGTTFHRVIAGFMIQGGDHLGDGTGDVGYNLIDELHPSLSHDRPGLLCMANKGPNTNGGQFFITDAAAPHLTAMKTYSIFGECGPVDVVHKIANAPKESPMSEHPLQAITINKVTIAR